jgi:hypothetical protein
LKRAAANHQPVDAQFQHLGDSSFVANSAAKLTGNTNCLANGTNLANVHWPPGASPIEIDDVQTLGAGGGKAARGFGGIIAEDGFSLVVALLKADALSSAEINRRPNLHNVRDAFNISRPECERI